MRMNKKGDEYGPPLLAVIVTVIVFIYLSIVLIDKINGVGKTIGDTQYKLLNTYDNAEKINFYIDEAAKRSANSALYDLAKNGGISNRDCSEYFGSTLLVSQDDDCMPKQESDITNEYLNMFNKEFKIYLSNYQYANVNSEYDLNYYEGLLVGISQNSITLPITSKIIQELKKPNETLIEREKIESLQGSSKIVEIAKTQLEKPYVKASKPSSSVANPTSFDCAGFTAWVIGTAGVKEFPASSTAKAQYDFMKNKNTLIYDSTDPTKNSVENYKKALNTQGMLLYSFPPADAWYTGHAALTIGDGKNIIEAGGISRDYVCKTPGPRGSCVKITKAFWNSGKPRFDAAGNIPGLDYTQVQNGNQEVNISNIKITQVNLTNNSSNVSNNNSKNSSQNNQTTLITMQSYNFEFLISDEDFTNSNAATQEQIQKFLEKRKSRLKDPIDGELPSKMIYDVAQKEGINPIVLLVTLQKEKSLISGDNSRNPSQNQLDAAMGCGCHDGASCKIEFKGFKNQISCSATSVLKKWYETGKKQEYPKTMKDINYGGRCSKNSNTGPNTITVKNAATYALYMYTPHTYDICLGNGQYGGGNKLFLQNYKTFYKEITGNDMGITYSTNELTASNGDIIDNIGAYSFTPAFEMDMGYDFTVYKKIFDTMFKLNYKYNDLEGNDKSLFMDNIVSEAKAIEPGVNWFKNCESSEEKMYYSFAEQYDLCANSPDNNCYCEIKVYPQVNLDRFNFIITTELPEGTEDSLKSEFLMNGNLNEEFSSGIPGFKRGKTDRSLSAKGDIKVSGKIENSNLLMDVEIPNSDGYESYSYKQDVLVPVLLYKENLNKNSKRLSFISPNLLSRSVSLQNGISKTYYDEVKDLYASKNIPICKVQKDTVKLCVNNDKKILVYDKINKNITFVDNTIKFAYTFRDILPPLAVYDVIQNNDAFMMDKSVILKWSHENRYDDALNFRIYYSKDDFDGKSMKEIKNDPNINVINLESEDKIILLGTDVSKPEFKVENNVLKSYYPNLDFDIEPDQVYDFSKNNQDDLITNYAAKINFNSDEEYYVLILAYDTKNNEIGIDTQRINYKAVKVKDNLPPATSPLDGFIFGIQKTDDDKIMATWFYPLKNTDGSPFDYSTDLKEYRIYYGETLTADEFFTSKMLKVSNDKVDNRDDLIEYNPKKGICVYVVPVDKQDNIQFNDNTKELMKNPAFFSPKCIAPLK